MSGIGHGSGEHLILSNSNGGKSKTTAIYKNLRTSKRLIRPRRVSKFSMPTRVTMLNILDILGTGHKLRGDTRMRRYILEIFMHNIVALKRPRNIMRDIRGVEIRYYSKLEKQD